MAKLNNLHDLSKDLLNVYQELREGKIEGKTANELANVAGKVIDSAKVIVAYNVVKQTIDRVDVLESKILQAAI